jgi:hypothetical protein
LQRAQETTPIGSSTGVSAFLHVVGLAALFDVAEHFANMMSMTDVLATVENLAAFFE